MSNTLRGSVYWEIWSDVFAFMSQHYPVTVEDQFPDQVAADWETCIEKYKGLPEERFAGDLLTDVMHELGRLYAASVDASGGV